jgi:hypothetical protein
MRPFLVDARKSTPDINYKDWQIWITPKYFEWEFSSPNKDGTRLVIYMLPRDQTSFIVAACWENIFDGWLELLLENSALRKEIDRTWPVFAQIVVNTFKQKYSAGVLSVLKDPDTDEDKFFVTSILGNVDVTSPLTWRDRGGETVQYIGHLSLLLLEELSTKKLSQLRVVRDSVWDASKGVLGGLLREYLADLPNTQQANSSNQNSHVSLRKPPIFQYFENLRKQ